MNLKPKKTQQKPLTVALKYIIENKLTNKRRLNLEHSLDPKTIRKIEAGENISDRTVERYFRVLMGIINDYRWENIDRREVFAENGDAEREEECKARVSKAKEILFDLALIQLGIPTDTEIMAFRFRNKIVRENT